MMELGDILRNFPVAITVTDREGRFIYANDTSARINSGGDAAALLGKQIMDCHNARSQQIIRELFAGATNVYTITKRGRKKLIFQAPWYQEGEVAGLVELSMELPDSMPHYDRDKGQ